MTAYSGRYGRFVIKAKAGRSVRGKTLVRVLCDCGTEKTGLAIRDRLPATRGELAAALGVDPRSISRSLARMSKHGVVEKLDGRWANAPGIDLDAVAEAVQTAGRGARQRQRHQDDRDGLFGTKTLEQFLARRPASRPKPSGAIYVDRHTGEVLGRWGDGSEVMFPKRPPKATEEDEALRHIWELGQWLRRRHPVHPPGCALLRRVRTLDRRSGHVERPAGPCDCVPEVTQADRFTPTSCRDLNSHSGCTAGERCDSGAARRPFGSRPASGPRPSRPPRPEQDPLLATCR